jgi:hypothetical protein
MTGELLEFRKRRTYLDECRFRGVFQLDEELRDEHAELTSQLANRRKETSAEVVNIAAISAGASDFSAALTALSIELRARTAGVVDAFIANGMGAAYLPLLKHILVNTDTTGEQAESLFRAARSSS